MIMRFDTFLEVLGYNQYVVHISDYVTGHVLTKKEFKEFMKQFRNNLSYLESFEDDFDLEEK